MMFLTHSFRDGKAVCSFCDQTIDGNVKLSLSEPFLSCHPECLKVSFVLFTYLENMYIHWHALIFA